MEASRELGAGETQKYVDELDDVIGSDDPTDSRLTTVIAIVESLPDYAVDFAAELAASEEPECLETAAIIVPELLKRGVEQNLADGELDRLRGIWEGLIKHRVDWVSELAISKFQHNELRLKEEDTVSLNWLRWSAANTKHPRQSVVNPNYLIENGFAKDSIRLVGTNQVIATEEGLASSEMIVDATV
jgi:hypothetical protein